MVSRNPAAAIFLSIAALFVFTLSTSAFASSSVGTLSTPDEREASAQKFVTQTLRIWQERLNLKDWDIRVELVRPDALEPRTLGNIHWDTNSKHATIGVLSAYDYTLPFRDMLSDMEFTIVHELVHLHLASLPRSDATRRNEEYAVNQIARALLTLSKR